MDHVVKISWFGPNGLINDTRYNISIVMINTTTNGSSLTFTTSLSDNGADYYCTVSASTVNGFELIIPSADVTSTNNTVMVESKLLLFIL